MGNASLWDFSTNNARIPEAGASGYALLPLCRMQNFDRMSLLSSDGLTGAFSWASDLTDQVVGNSRKAESTIQKRLNKHCKENFRKRLTCRQIAIASQIGEDRIAISFCLAAKKRASTARNKLIFWSICSRPIASLHRILRILSFARFAGSGRTSLKFPGFPPLSAKSTAR